MTFKNPLHLVPGVWRQKGRKKGGAAPVVPAWWTIGGVYTAADVILAVNFKKGTTLAEAIVNESGGTGVVTDPGGAATPTWAAGAGITGDLVAMYLSTNIVPVSGYSMFVQFSSESPGGTPTLAGTTNGFGAWFSLSGRIGGGAEYGDATRLGSKAPTIVAGNLGVVPNIGYRNGVVNLTPIPAAAGGVLPVLFILCANLFGTPGQFSSATMTGIWVANIAPTAPQVATLAAAMLALP